MGNLATTVQTKWCYTLYGKDVTCGQVWWPILGICALHLTHPNAHTQQWVVNKHTHTRAGRYDDIYRMDEIKSLSFQILLYRLFRGVAKCIVYGNTFSSFGWLRSLHATTGREGKTEAGGSEQEHDQPGQNDELVPKRGTTTVAWTRVLSTAVLKQPILSRWNANNRANVMCARGVREERAFFCRFIGHERLHKHNYMHKNPRLCKYPHKHSDLGLKRE